MKESELQEAGEIRRQLVRKFGGPFRESFWQRLYRDDVRDYLENPNVTTWESLEAVAKDLWEFQQEVVTEVESRVQNLPKEEGAVIGERSRRKRGSREDSGSEVDSLELPGLTNQESLRAEVFAEYLAKVAKDDYYVARFRSKELQDWLLGPEEAHRFIRSSAAQAFPRSWFDNRQIPLENHGADLVDYESGVQEGHFVADYATITVSSPGNVAVTQRVRSRFDGERRFRVLAFRNEAGEAESIHVWRGSVLGELQEAASQLAIRFPWDEANASWYLLTGKPPAMPAIRTAYHWDHARFIDSRLEPVHFNYGTMNLSVAPWVSAQTFRKIHKALQQQMLKKRESHQLDERRLELLRFVIANEAPLTLTRSRRRKVGGRLQTAWDEQNPRWAYGKHEQPTSLFWRDYDEAERQVAPLLETDMRSLRQGLT